MIMAMEKHYCIGAVFKEAAALLTAEGDDIKAIKEAADQCVKEIYAACWTDSGVHAILTPLVPSTDKSNRMRAEREAWLAWLVVLLL